MVNNQYFGGAIWTHHALDRLLHRGLSQKLASFAFQHPDSIRPGKQKGTTELTKTIDHHRVTIIATQNAKKEWIIFSVWVDPPYPGSLDWKRKEFYKQYKRASFWGKFFLIFKRQLGF